MPEGGDPETVAWLKLSRARRRAAWADAREHMKSAAFVKAHGTALTKGQRRAATPWQPLLLPPYEWHLFSGRANQETALLIRGGLNRLQRRTLKAGSRGPSGRSR